MPSHSLENMLVNTKAQQERKPRPHPEQALKCPRCDSTNTKFCYYNNYSLTQPRYFCKSCRRYWTKGGTLRNVPVGGGCRKNKRSSSSSSSSSSKRVQDQPLTPNSNPLSNLPPLTYDSNDLTLAFARLQKQSCGQLGYDEHDLSILGNPTSTHCDILGNPSGINTTNPAGFIDAMRNGFLESQNHYQNLYYGFGNGNIGEVENGGGGVSSEMGLHPYEEISSNAATTTAVTVTTMKQELCHGRDNENRILWGFPWQMNNNGGDHHGNNLGDFDTGRESWNGMTPSWHGLLNSPLM
ncbi:hypothetical protein FEM48_Zijuj02G0088500 [Ziziphus jujuba var. spinosa]|uniref:Dof zinc finger protein n=1 Tax=Ziziphus jujuba var. spinosa TaxID=714518 RepID=A0A978VUT0_ZIZJJ|nr:hypothetical protein FEM48_Zijuj02G0088500 [Ziziphus jujuba var. spinosa]